VGDVVMVMVVVTMMVVVRGARVGRHGEHRQRRRDGEELGEGHGAAFFWSERPATGPGRHHAR
jgi:hypothetical protein